MSDKPSLQIDDDWKRQAQEEKQRLAEEQKRLGAERRSAAASAASEPAQRELPPASFEAIVSSMLTQAMYYLGEIGTADGENAVDLDMARHYVDLLQVLEQKTRGNLTPGEQQLLDSTLYELRMRYVSLGTQSIR